MKEKVPDNKGNNRRVGDNNADCRRYIAASVATILMKGLDLDEIRHLYAILLLVTQNIQAEISLRALFPVGLSTPLTGISEEELEEEEEED